MKNDEVVEIVGAVEVSADVQKRIRTVGVRGLDFDMAKELGVFQRIANMLCVAHTTIMAAYRVYGGVDYLIDQINARKNEIKREMNAFEKAFDRFVNFWTSYYAKGKNSKEVMVESERMYTQIMRWSQLPDSWQLGGKQRTEDPVDLAIKIDDKDDEKVYTFRKYDVERETIESDETWCVLKFDAKNCKQETVNVDMDKASAIMVAKRLSDQDKNLIYTVAIMRDAKERTKTIIPYKAYKGNNTIGKITKTLK